MELVSLNFEKLTTPIRVKHSCNPGDAIATLASLKAYWERTGRKIIFCQQLNMPAQYYPGAVHGTLSDSDGTTPVCMNQSMYDMLKPLFLSQEYIEDMEVFNGQKIHIDIDVIRKEVFVNLPKGSIQSWPMFAYPDLAYDISTPWIHLPEKKLSPQSEWIKDKVIINFTERYRNGLITYHFLKKFENRLAFAGTEREYIGFCQRWELNMPRLQVNDFLDLSYAIENCKFLLSNQSMQWNIAEAIKSPRVLEVCEFAQNNLPFYGKHSYGFFNQTGVEYYVDLLMG